MRPISVTLGIALILAGMALGLYVTIHYFGEGLLYIKAGYTRDGLILLLLWSELLGILSTLALVIPGVLLLRSIDRRQPLAVSQRRANSATKP